MGCLPRRSIRPGSRFASLLRDIRRRYYKEKIDEGSSDRWSLQKSIDKKLLRKPRPMLLISNSPLF